MEYDERTAETLDIAQYATHGFCATYPLKRHRYETLANTGCFEARQDWVRYLGHVSEFGGCNPVNGNFTALVLPMCKPERLRLVAYKLEYAFLHDNVVEDAESDNSTEQDDFSLGRRESAKSRVKTGRKQIQAKMMLQLNATDRVCVARIMHTWKTMLSTTLRDKDKDFANLDEYLDFRIIDTGAPFVESAMLFGMGMVLTKEEDSMLTDVIEPCYASLALANDYFSFDREWAEAQSKPGASKPTNAVWLYMRWRSVNTAIAKRLVAEAANRYETLFLERCDQFRVEHAPVSPKLDLYLRALSCQVSGNVVWSLNCPRYHPEFRYDPNAGIEDAITVERRGTTHQVNGGDSEGHEEDRPRMSSVVSMVSNKSALSEAGATSTSGRSLNSRSSSMSSVSTTDDKPGGITTQVENLGLEHLEAPFAYVSSLPSKGVRDTLADALNLWVGLPEDALQLIKRVVGDLHTASLMLDDIEDGSDLRRGHAAAHTVFGIPQTINAASFAIVEAIRQAHEMSDVVPGATDIVLEQLRDLHTGQSYDLYWTRHASCPTEAEYLEMVSKKTGGLFRLLSRLMCGRAKSEIASAVDDVVQQIGIYFQIRDDYKNLESDEYTKNKGFCEDLDEGKVSFPLVHYFNTAPPHDALPVREVLEQRRETGTGGLGESQKKLVLEHLKASKTLEYTRETLKMLEARIDSSVTRLEHMTGWENWVLRLCMQKLSVQDSAVTGA